MSKFHQHFGRFLKSALLTLALLMAVTSVRADIYGYIDADGMGHFSTEKLDDRYQLFKRNGAAFDSSRLKRSGGTPAQRDNPLFRYLSQHPNLKKYEPLVYQAAQEFTLEPALLKAIMAAESGFNPTAVSPKGAVGLMQIMPATAERYGLTSDSGNPISKKLTDPRTNIRLGARYLRDLLKLFPLQQELVLASYNAGEGAVKKYQNQVPPYPETRNYVQLVRQFYQLYKPALNHYDSDGEGPTRVRMVIPGRRMICRPACSPATSTTPISSANSAAASPLIE